MHNTRQNNPVLVTGSKGQLATSLARLGGAAVKCVGRPDFDFDRPETLRAVLDSVQPAVVINAAAWSAVDLAESEPEAAARANTQGPSELARLCALRNIPFIHISTDYVFSGDKGAPYVETDAVSPQTVYGRTKAEGEVRVLAANPQSLIFRTSWVYSPQGKNFLCTMLNAAARNSVLKVVADQRGNPTSADDLAQAILSVVRILHENGWKDEFAGIYHACGTGQATWYSLAIEIFKNAARYGLSVPEVRPIQTKDWPTPARRPVDSRMDNTKLARVFGVVMPEWEDSVRRAVDSAYAVTEK
ncbi:dTDP-4-dehydrorhamnose reductase [Acetobacter okinawensis]|uniref:dTDP-4-dehydrorhamnose reductase n=1 Tax=Acetobacter okinawensis TaxID=1076594 RepID=UPI001BA65A07|nr:dTDP-4-dehydrorhamnose reductase [Acetobacter okinawensis]MBS0988147.1 dTDP-4-dehydrorhamnose reductase [Acetobacter okinawensis]